MQSGQVPRRLTQQLSIKPIRLLQVPMAMGGQGRLKKLLRVHLFALARVMNSASHERVAVQKPEPVSIPGEPPILVKTGG
jgi:hypothetical protein